MEQNQRAQLKEWSGSKPTVRARAKTEPKGRTGVVVRRQASGQSLESGIRSSDIYKD